MAGRAGRAFPEGLAAIVEARYEQAYRHYRAGLTANRSLNMVIWQRAIPLMCDAAVQAGHADEALETIDWMDAVPGGSSPVLRMSVAYGRAVLAQGPQAEPLFAQALTLSEQSAPFEHARLQLAYGIWLRRHRRTLEARESLRSARDTFDVLGAMPWAERARHQLRAAGEPSQQRAVSPAEQLTPAELDIARLAAQGMTNREIGQRLYLSHRTVGAHLYRIFPKLDITSRRELAGLFLPSEQRPGPPTGTSPPL